MINTISIVLGCLTAVIPHFVFYKMVMHYQGALKAKAIVNYFYKGEAVKICFTVLIMLLAYNIGYFFVDMAIAPAIFVGAFSAMTILQSIFWTIYRNKRLR